MSPRGSGFAGGFVGGFGGSGIPGTDAQRQAAYAACMACVSSVAPAPAPVGCGRPGSEAVAAPGATWAPRPPGSTGIRTTLDLPFNPNQQLFAPPATSKPAAAQPVDTDALEFQSVLSRITSALGGATLADNTTSSPDDITGEAVRRPTHFATTTSGTSLSTLAAWSRPGSGSSASGASAFALLTPESTPQFHTNAFSATLPQLVQPLQPVQSAAPDAPRTLLITVCGLPALDELALDTFLEQFGPLDGVRRVAVPLSAAADALFVAVFQQPAHALQAWLRIEHGMLGAGLGGADVSSDIRPLRAAFLDAAVLRQLCGGAADDNLSSPHGGLERPAVQPLRVQVGTNSPGGAPSSVASSPLPQPRTPLDALREATVFANDIHVASPTNSTPESRLRRLHSGSDASSVASGVSAASAPSPTISAVGDAAAATASASLAHLCGPEPTYSVKSPQYTLPIAPIGRAHGPPDGKRRPDQGWLRELRRRLEGHITYREAETLFNECLPDMVALCVDYVGNIVVQKFIERLNDDCRLRLIEQIAPHFAAIGTHKNGTWVAQRLIDFARTPAQIVALVDALRPYTVMLMQDPFGNYVLQCCLRLGPRFNDFVFDAIVRDTVRMGTARFGARGSRTCLESIFATAAQKKRVAAAVAQHAVVLAQDANGVILVNWLLDASALPGRYRALAPALLPHLEALCMHKLGSSIVLKLVNQQLEADARALVVAALVAMPVPALRLVVSDPYQGARTLQRILACPSVSASEALALSERVKSATAGLPGPSVLSGGPCGLGLDAVTVSPSSRVPGSGARKRVGNGSPGRIERSSPVSGRPL